METADNSSKVDVPDRVSKRMKIKRWVAKDLHIPMWLYIAICFVMMGMGRILERYHVSFWNLLK